MRLCPQNFVVVAPRGVKWFLPTLLQSLIHLLLLLTLLRSSGRGGVEGAEEDYMMTCSRPIKSPRRSRLHEESFYCDKFEGNGRTSSWCNIPGDHYPWHAVRRFVFENQGLMRRMYGEVRQLSLLRMEFDEKSPEMSSNSILSDSGREYLSDDDLLEQFSDRKGFPPLKPPPLPSPVTFSDLFDDELESEEAINAKQKGGGGVLEEESLRVLSEIADVQVQDAPDGVDDDEPLAEKEEGPLNDSSRSPPTSPVEYDDEGGPGGSGGQAESSTIPQSIEKLTTMSPPSIQVKFRSSSEEVPTISEEEGVSTTEREVLNSQEDSELTTTNGPGGGFEVKSSEFTSINGSRGASTAPTILPSTSTVKVEVEEPGTLSPEDPLERNGGITDPGAFSDDNAVQGSQSPSIRVVNACPVKEEVVAPYWANNTRGEILALLNLYPFEQYIHWEKCNYENKQMYCRDGCRCEQQYRLHRLLAFDPNNECRGIFSDWFRFPSCCICKCYLYESVANDLYNNNLNNNRSPRSKKHFYYNK